MELPPDGERVAKHVMQRFNVWRGPAGVILLFEHGEPFTPDQYASEFEGYLDPPYGYAMLRQLRNSPNTRALEEVKYAPFPQQGYVQDGQRGDRSPGWYWHVPDGEGAFICPRHDGVRVNVETSRRFSWDAAANNSRLPWQSVAGVVAGGEFIYPRARSNSDFELLVCCPQGATREFTLLVNTAGGDTAGSSRWVKLVKFVMARDLRGAAEFVTDGRDTYAPPYVLAFDTKGKPRVFKRP